MPQSYEDVFGDAKAKTTVLQKVYINDLYNQLDIPYSKREKPETLPEASKLIDRLKKQLNEKEPEND